MPLDQTSTDDPFRLMAQMPNYGSEFAGTYANHAPMVLVALDRLGGSPSRQAQFFEHYRSAKQLYPFPPPTAFPLSRDDWRRFLGRRDREPDMRVYFRSEVVRLGVLEALKTYLPVLSAGVGASALHALMRLAYALIQEDDDEVAISLAYWASTYLDLPPATGRAPITKDPGDVLRRVADIEALRQLPLEELLWHNMRASGGVAEFAPVVDWLDIAADTQSKMAATAIALYAGTMDFCALHAVTGMHWMRIVLPYSPEPELLLRHFWQCIAALMGEMGFPAIPAANTLAAWRLLPSPEWPVIFQAARKSNDEHDLSIVFSASEEEKVYADPLYRLATARRMGLVPDYTR